MDLGRGEVELIGDLGGSLSLLFVPDHDVLYRDPMSRDTRLATGDSRSGLDLVMLMHRILNARLVPRGRMRQAQRRRTQPPLPRQTARLIRPAVIDLRRLAVQGDDDDLSQSVSCPFTEQTKQCHCGDRSASAARNWHAADPGVAG